MKNITINQIDKCLSDALANKIKNVLFVSPTVEYTPALEWFKAHPEYILCRATPAEIYEEENGILVKRENTAAISDENFTTVNNEKGIWFINIFSEKCITDFEGFTDIIKNRFYINKFTDGTKVKHSLDKMALFVAFTATPNPNDNFALDEKYYDLFDEIYVVA